MTDLTDEQYKAEYDKAAAALDSAAAEPVKVEAAITDEPAKVEVEEVKAAPEVDPVAELRTRLEKTEKALKDTQAWGTKSQQRLAEIERERLLAAREREKPGILDANPELAEAIRYVQNDPIPKLQQQDSAQQWRDAISRAHPGIFDAGIDPELEADLMTRLTGLGDSIYTDPLIAIREITEGKLAFAERQISKRFAIEAEKQAKKSAMSVPNLGGGVVDRTSIDKDAAEVNRIKNMSDADFAKEVKKAKGY